MTLLALLGPVLAFSTYLGGPSEDSAAAIAVDREGDVYVAGSTEFPGFPTTPGAFQTDYAGPNVCGPFAGICGDAFVTKLDPTGKVIYSTLFGGPGVDRASAIAVDAEGNAYILGVSTGGLRITPGAFRSDPVSPAPSGAVGAWFVAKLNRDGSGLVYSTYLGHAGGFRPGSIAVDARGNAYLAGAPGEGEFPTTPGAFQTSPPPAKPGLPTSPPPRAPRNAYSPAALTPSLPCSMLQALPSFTRRTLAAAGTTPPSPSPSIPSGLYL